MSNKIELAQEDANRLIAAMEKLQASPVASEGAKRESVEKATQDLGNLYKSIQDANEQKAKDEQVAKRLETLETLLKSQTETLEAQSKQILKFDKQLVESSSPQGTAAPLTIRKDKLGEVVKKELKNSYGEGIYIYKSGAPLETLHKDGQLASQYAVAAIGSGLPENLSAVANVLPTSLAIKGFVENQVVNTLDPIYITLTDHKIADPVEKKISKSKEAGGFNGAQSIFRLYSVALDVSNNAKTIQAEVTDLMLMQKGDELERFISGEIVDAFDRHDSERIISGSGKGEPRGILTYDAWTRSGFVTEEPNSGSEEPGIYERGKLNTFQFSTSDPTQPFSPGSLRSFQTVALESRYAAQAVYVMNRHTYAKIQRLNSDTRYHLIDHTVPQTTANALPNPTGLTLFGKPVVLDDAMPLPNPGAKAIIYGDLRRAYRYAEFAGLRMKVDNTPEGRQNNNDYFWTKYSDGTIKDFKALALIEISAP